MLAGIPVARTTALDALEGLARSEEAQTASAGGSLQVRGTAPTHPAPSVTLGDSDKKKLPQVVTERRKQRQKEAAAVAEDEAASATTSTDAAYASGDVVQIIHAAAAEFGLDGDYLVSVAQCESGLDPQAYNSAGYHGLFQYDDTTWSAYGYGSIWDPVAQARTTAELIAGGQASRWPNCA